MEKNQSVNTVSAREAAAILNISEATLRNWVKSSVIAAASFAPLRLDPAEIDKFLRSGGSSRLRSRANRRFSEKFFPAEYVEKGRGDDLQFTLCRLRQYLMKENLDLKKVLFAAARKIFAQDRRKCVKKELDKWEIGKIEPIYEKLAEEVNLDRKNGLNQLYCGLSGLGTRAGNGCFFTFGTALHRMAAMAERIPPGGLVLDPACGGGNLLTAIVEKYQLKPEQLMGVDKDFTAVRIAALNMLNLFSGKEFEPEIIHHDALNCTFERKFALVLANPPWGTQPRGGFEDSFAAFIRLALSVLERGGQGVFLLPEAFLMVRKHEAIRSFLLENSRIQAVCRLGRCFDGVFSAAAAVSFKLPEEKGTPQKNIHSIELLSPDGSTKGILSYRELLERKYFPPECSAAEFVVLEKIRRHPHLFLKDNARWALGVVTGNNKKFLIPGGEMAVTGKNLKPFFITGGVPLDLRAGRVQQMAEERFYRAEEKLFYRFIGGKLCFALDREQRISLNSANILIPDTDKLGMRIEAVMALLNSAVMQFFYRKSCGELKILRRNLEKLPLPRLTAEQHNHIFDLTVRLCRGKLSGNILEEYIISLYDLTEEEKNLVMSFSSLKETNYPEGE